ncbi:hypothetical protein [Leuconostoc mesenteroides]|uniref:hypothetical protein n=1 Tax=Leuconostoc mesenteroides TaxID=1245 RepID=UPI000B0839F3|nr:hypothetical protein [Leuconostoc mesenteroides]
MAKKTGELKIEDQLWAAADTLRGSNVVADVDNVELVLPARYTKEKLEADLHD